MEDKLAVVKKECDSQLAPTKASSSQQRRRSTASNLSRTSFSSTHVSPKKHTYHPF